MDVFDRSGLKMKVIFVKHSMVGIVAAEIAATKGHGPMGAVIMGLYCGV